MSGPGFILSPAPFSIQPATWRDLNVLRQVESACFGKDAWPLWDLVAALTLPDIIRLKAVSEGKMIGFIAGEIKRSDRMGWITTLGVLPEYRRHKVGSALLEACEDQLQQQRIRLCVRQSNQGAIQLYQRTGYQQVGVWPSYYQDGEDALVMEKRFTKA